MNLNTHILDKHTYVIYTDGACIGNPGPGGWAAIIFNKGKRKLLLVLMNKLRIIEWN